MTPFRAPLLDLPAELQELAALEIEAMGWLPPDAGQCLHLGKPVDEDVIITVTGTPDLTMAGSNILWLSV